METEQTRQLKEYYDQFGKPALSQVGPQVLSGFADNDLFSKVPDASARDALEGQFRNAGAQMLNDAPIRGGRLAKQMTGLTTDRALAVSNLYADKGKEARAMLANMLPSIFPNAAANQQTMSNISGQQNQRNQLAAQMTAQNQASMGQGLGGLLSQVGGGLLSHFFPASSRVFKEAVVPFDGDVLQQVADTPIYTWRYIGDTREHIGPVTEEAPPIIVSDDGMALVPVDYLGFLFAAVKALNVEVQGLKEARSCACSKS